MYQIVQRYFIILLYSLLLSSTLYAQTAEEIEVEANLAIEKFKRLTHGGDLFLQKVQGYLVFPQVYKGGYILGGEYGEGVLRINGKSVAYYSITSLSIGLQFGVQQTSYIFAFANQSVLTQFLSSNGWEAGIDGSIALAEWGEGIDLSSISYEKPIYAFVFNSKGVMANISLEGTKFTRIIPE